MATGNATHDEHMQSAGWLDMANYPTITFSDITLTKSPTPSGRAHLDPHGVAQPLTVHANVRCIPTFPRFGDNVVRVNASFSLTRRLRSG